MKTIYSLILSICLFVIALLIHFLSGWDQLLIDLIFINMIAIIVRQPLILLAKYFFEKQLFRVLASTIINISFGISLFLLIFVLSFDFFIALLSFMVVTISFTFKSIINNISAGALILTTEQFEIGDMIETNGIEGVVREISLNYTKLREFDGVNIIVPNSKVFGSTLIKFTHRKIKHLKLLKKDESRKGKMQYRRYLRNINKFLSLETKITRYTKEVEILGKIDPEELDHLFDEVFEKYELVFGIRPSYCIDTTRYGRLRIILYIDSKDPILVLNNIDAFLREMIFKLYSEAIYEGWEEYKKNNKIITPNYEVNGE